MIENTKGIKLVTITNPTGRVMYTAYCDDGLVHCFDNDGDFCPARATPKRKSNSQDPMCVTCGTKAIQWATPS